MGNTGTPGAQPWSQSLSGNSAARARKTQFVQPILKLVRAMKRSSRGASKVLKKSLFTASWRQPLHEGCIPNVRERRGKERPGTTADGPSLTQHQIECILAFACCHEYLLNMSRQGSLHLSNWLLRDRGFFGKPVRGLLSRFVSSHIHIPPSWTRSLNLGGSHTASQQLFIRHRAFRRRDRWSVQAEPSFVIVLFQESLARSRGVTSAIVQMSYELMKCDVKDI